MCTLRRRNFCFRAGNFLRFSRCLTRKIRPYPCTFTPLPMMHMKDLVVLTEIRASVNQRQNEWQHSNPPTLTSSRARSSPINDLVLMLY
jgi:hypothetical protein